MSMNFSGEEKQMTNKELLKTIELYASIKSLAHHQKYLCQYKASEKTLADAEIEFEKIKEEVNNWLCESLF
jgi:hypothetical protein